MQRGRIAAGILAITSLGVSLGLVTIVGSTSAVAGPLGAQPPLAAPVTSSVGDRTLTVDSATDLPATNASITVSGSGFDTDHGLFVAVCQAGLKKKDPLTNCIGGAIPGQNGTDSWAWVSDDPDADGAIAWGEDGSFIADLTLAAASGDSVDCLEVACALIARSDAEKPSDRPADLTIPISFLQPATDTTDENSTEPTTEAGTDTSTSKTKPTKTGPTKTSPTESTAEQTTDVSETETSTEVTETTPVTIKVDGILAPEIQVGARQTVIFSGFLPAEKVQITIFSEPKELDPMTASPEGVLLVSFEVTEDLIPGTHIVQAVGLTSNASASVDFTVLPAVAPSITASTVDTTSQGSLTVSSSESVTATSATVETTESSAETTISTSTTPSLESSVPIPTTSQDQVTNSNADKAIWWLLAGLLVVFVVIVVISWIAIVRRQQNKREQDRLRRDEELAEAAFLEQERRGAPDAPTEMIDSGPRTFQSPMDSGSHHGLISGQGSGDGPALYSGQGISTPGGEPGYPSYQDEPTQFIPTPVEPTELIRTDGPVEHEENYGLFTHTTDHQQDAQIDPGPETAAWPFDSAESDAADEESGDDPAAGSGWTEPPAR